MAQCIDMSSDASNTKLIFEDVFAHDDTKLAEWEEKYEEHMGVAPVTEDRPVMGFMHMLLINPADGTVVQDADTNNVELLAYFGKIDPVGGNVYKAGSPFLSDINTRKPLENLDSWSDYGLSEEVITQYETMLKKSGREERSGRTRNNPTKRAGEDSTMIYIEDGANKYVHLTLPDGIYEQFTPCGSPCTLSAPVEA